MIKFDFIPANEENPEPEWFRLRCEIEEMFFEGKLCFTESVAKVLVKELNEKFN